MRSSDTKYVAPNYEVDDRIYWSDIDLHYMEVMNNFQGLINDKKYEEAQEYIDNSGVFYFGAWILNLLENRLVGIGEYLWDLEKPFFGVHQDAEPSPTEADITDGIYVWVD